LNATKSFIFGLENLEQNMVFKSRKTYTRFIQFVDSTIEQIQDIFGVGYCRVVVFFDTCTKNPNVVNGASADNCAVTSLLAHAAAAA
jgi:hypothetical protein